MSGFCELSLSYQFIKLRSKWGNHSFSSSKNSINLAVAAMAIRRHYCARHQWFLVAHALSICIGNNFRIKRPQAMYKFQNIGQLTTQIDELKKEVSALKRERKVLFFIALCGVSYAVLQFAPVAAIVLFVVSFSLCFLEDIVKGE